ncbi:hypothetical protein [Micromonospora sp. LOL_024]|uniref:hypothetical protein n=1 Tax=Micromonospora sp. LOL_024 TaxID=3345412 RepID=UPI003A8607D6
MPLKTTPSLGRITTLTIAAAALLVSAAACGGGSDGPTEDVGGNVRTAYTDCMRENGVTVATPTGEPRTRPSGLPSGMPRPSGDARPGDGNGFPGGGVLQKPEGIDDATWQKAQSACASVRPTGRPGGNGPGNGANAAYRNCLQDRGVTLGQNSLPTDDPKTKEAMEACKALMPTARPTPSS